jgi:antitoxin VapB
MSYASVDIVAYGFEAEQAAALRGRRVRLFKNSRSQAVRIPREWELPGSEAVIRKDGNRLIVSPAPKTSLLAALRELGPLHHTDRLPPIEPWLRNHFPDVAGNSLREAGFEGFVSADVLRDSQCAQVPKSPGVYLVVRGSDTVPEIPSQEPRGAVQGS